MDCEAINFFILFICMFLFSWNLSLLDSKNYWRKKWEKELNKNDKNKN